VIRAEVFTVRQCCLAQNKSQQPVEVAGFSEMGGGRIELPTPEFSIVVSDASESVTSIEPASSSTSATDESKTSAQQITQHENAMGAEEVEFPDVREHSGVDPALSLLVEVWGELPGTVRGQILRLADLSATDFNRH
jgi:hypothetical protein